MQVKELPKVLIFIDWYLPGFKAGGPIQSVVNLVSHLKQDYTFYIVTRDTDYTSTTPYTTVIANSWNKVNGAQVYYISRQALKSRNIRALIKEIEPDHIYINGIYSFYFSVLPLIISKQMGYENILVAGRGMLAQSAIQVKGIKKKLFFKLAKFYKLHRGVTFHATNLAEKADIQAVMGENAIVKIAPNLSEANSVKETLPVARVKESGVLHLVSVARIAPEKNTAFALEILSHFKGAGKIKLDLYGPIYNEAYWQACTALMQQMPAHIKVNYKGSLEKEKVQETLQQYHALLMPTKGENFGHIILESFMAGCPVIISDQTPWKNLEQHKVGYDLALTDAAGYHAALSELIKLDQEQFNSLSEKALQYGLAYCQDQTHLEANKALFRFE